MLGNGRPFIMELLDPKRIYHTEEEVTEMQKKMNSSGLIQVVDLKQTTKYWGIVFSMAECSQRCMYQIERR